VRCPGLGRAALDAKLRATLNGKATSSGAAQRIELAYLCQRPYKRLYVVSARFYVEAFAADPKLEQDPPAWHR
jgi:hypothetical protein